MPARLQIDKMTLSKRPWYRCEKEYVEDDEFYYRMIVINDGPDPFPAQDMRVSATWFLPSGRPFHSRQLRIPKEKLGPGEYSMEDANVKVVMSGTWLMSVSYEPSGAGCELHDSSGRVIASDPKNVIQNFHGISTIELETIAGLYLAAIAAAIAALGLVLSFVLR